MLYVIQTVRDSEPITDQPVEGRTLETYADTEYAQALLAARKYRSLPHSYAIVTDHPELYDPGVAS